MHILINQLLDSRPALFVANVFFSLRWKLLRSRRDYANALVTIHEQAAELSCLEQAVRDTTDTATFRVILERRADVQRERDEAATARLHAATFGKGRDDAIQP